MLTRILTGVLLAPLVVLLFLMGPVWAQAVVLIAASALCLVELYAMALPDSPFERWVGVALGVALQTSMWLAPSDHVGDWLPALFIPALVVVLRPDPIERAAFRLFALWAGLLYIVMPFSYGIAMLSPDGKPWILLVLGVVWAGDTGAYFAGRFLGKHKLHPKVSPKKTIEGSIGGLISSVGAGFLMYEVLGLHGLAPWKLAVFSAAGGALGQLGDLAESLIKRACNVKDSGTILPGHGGMLDRVDGVIFALPFFYFALTAWR
jgi:phosphatidate cytidylyltransferase